MATETTKYAAQSDTEARHSALEELYRDERRPALLLLSGLVIAIIFFALGVMVGRWISSDQPARINAAPASNPSPTPAAQANTVQTTQTTQAPSNQASAAVSPSPSQRAEERRYTLLIATFNTPKDAQPLIKKLEQAGYKDVRTSTPRAGERQTRFSVLVGRYTSDEAEQLAARMRATNDPRLRNVRVIETPVN